MKGAPIVVSDPIVPLRETVTVISKNCLAKAPNKLNRIIANMEPIDKNLTAEIDNGLLATFSDQKERSKYFNETYGWDINHCKKIWCFAPDGKGTNVLVDTSKAVDYLNDVKDSIVSMFEITSKEGILCEEPLRGVKLNIVDALIHSDRSHRGGKSNYACYEACFLFL